MSTESKKRFDGYNCGIHIRSDTVYLNCRNANNNQIAVAIEFHSVKNLKHVVFTFGKEDIDSLFFSKVKVPINERKFFAAHTPGTDQCQFQFPGARIFLAPYHASVFCDIVDEFYDS